MKFEEHFFDWLNHTLNEEIPQNIAAFCFNLDYPAGDPNVMYGIELIGASRFDKTDPDWACDEIWEPKHRHIHIPLEFSTEDWEICLAKSKALVEAYLNSGNPNISKLKQSQAIAIGFVDGALDLIWLPA